jgi:hypothetical protein
MTYNSKCGSLFNNQASPSVSRVLVISASTVTTSHTSTAVVTAAETTTIPAATKILTSSLSPDVTSVGAVHDRTPTVSCMDLPPSERQEGVPTSNETYSVSFRYVILLIIFISGI